MLAKFHVRGITLLLRAVLNMFVRNWSLRKPICFRCLLFSLSGHCELLFSLCFIASWTTFVVSVMVYPCILCVTVNGSVCLVCCVFGSVCELFGEICLGVGGSALLDIPCIVFQRM